MNERERIHEKLTMARLSLQTTPMLEAQLETVRNEIVSRCKAYI